MQSLHYRIHRFSEGRGPKRLALKLAYMRESSFVFLRGTCQVYYERHAKPDILFTALLARFTFELNRFLDSSRLGAEIFVLSRRSVGHLRHNTE